MFFVSEQPHIRVTRGRPPPPGQGDGAATTEPHPRGGLCCRGAATGTETPPRGGLCRRCGRALGRGGGGRPLVACMCGRLHTKELGRETLCNGEEQNGVSSELFACMHVRGRRIAQIPRWRECSFSGRGLRFAGPRWGHYPFFATPPARAVPDQLVVESSGGLSWEDPHRRRRCARRSLVWRRTCLEVCDADAWEDSVVRLRGSSGRRAAPRPERGGVGKIGQRFAVGSRIRARVSAPAESVRRCRV